MSKKLYFFFPNRVKLLALIVLLATAVHLLALLLHLVLQGVSPRRDKQTAQSVQLGTCAPHPSKGLYAVPLGAPHLVRQGKRLVLHALQASSVLPQSKCCAQCNPIFEPPSESKIGARNTM